jgi:hypothetical protein
MPDDRHHHLEPLRRRVQTAEGVVVGGRRRVVLDRLDVLLGAGQHDLHRGLDVLGQQVFEGDVEAQVQQWIILGRRAARQTAGRHRIRLDDVLQLGGGLGRKCAVLIHQGSLRPFREARHPPSRSQRFDAQKGTLPCSRPLATPRSRGRLYDAARVAKLAT